MGDTRAGRWLPIAAYVAALIAAGSCTSLTGPTPGLLAGRYVLTDPVPVENGFTLLADTLTLGADGSLFRSQVLKGFGPIADVHTFGAGNYHISDGGVVLVFTCYAGYCDPQGALTLEAAVLQVGVPGTRLVLDEDGRKTILSRTQ